MPIIDYSPRSKAQAVVENFISWLEEYGETSYDHQSFYSGSVGRNAKELYYKRPLIGMLAVAPIVFLEALIPEGRRFFGRPMRFPIADAHYAMGFALLAKDSGRIEYYDRAKHFLEKLIASRSQGFKHFCWGYPFDWVTRTGTIPAHTPFITTLPYVYEAFKYAHQMDQDHRWLEVMRSIADHALLDIKDIQISPGVISCGYGPYDAAGGVVNASAYRAFLLIDASLQFSDEKCMDVASGNINFVLNCQNPDGSWPYAVDGERNFVDHFHTCFVLKALAKIEKLTGRTDCRQAIEKGIAYYQRHLLDENGLPKPFSVAPRLTVYRRELYDYAECINLCLLLRDRINKLENTLNTVLNDLLSRWVKADGSFRSRELTFGWDNVPMHRWAQSQMFRSLCFFLIEQNQLNQRIAQPPITQSSIN
jgi:hypothetical protein